MPCMIDYDFTDVLTQHILQKLGLAPHAERNKYANRFAIKLPFDGFTVVQCMDDLTVELRITHQGKIILFKDPYQDFPSQRTLNALLLIMD